MIKVGILGLGGIGATHARALADLARSAAEVEVVAHSGGSPGLIAECGWPAARRLDPAELITDAGIDVLAICSPSSSHAGHAEQALLAGKHVVIEKPMAVTTEEAVRLRDLARDTGLLVSPVAQRRFEPLNIGLRAALQGSRLGRVVLAETFVHWHRGDDYYGQASWRTAPGGGGGSLMNQGLHNVDLLCWLLGGASAVCGHAATLGHRIEVEDTTVAALRFVGGALGVIATTTATPPGMPSEVAIWTTSGSATISQSGIERWDFPGVAQPASGELPGSGASDPAAIGVAGHVAQWTDVLQALADGRDPVITADDGLQTVAVLDGIYRSSASGRTIEINDLIDTTAPEEVQR